MAELNIPDTILEEFRCSICKHYLSSAPVQVLLPNGHNICHLCSLSTGQPTCRQLTFEALLSKLSFPCQFKNYGCEERVLFGQANEHEDNCTYRAYICPASTTCAWEGSAAQIFEHFTKEHSNLIKENVEFKLQVDQDEKGIFIFMLDDVYFIVKYNYNATTGNLRYDVRFLTNIQEATYKIRLANDSDCDYNSSMKGGTILPYSCNFYSMQVSKTVILNNYMQVLDNPDCIIVAVKASAITKFNQVNASAEQLTVNYELLQSLRCKKCRGYLIPPLYEGVVGPACWRCKQKFNYTKPLRNNELIERVTKINFPCRWRGCGFVGKAINLLKHEAGCQFRVFNCTECKSTFTWESALVHLQYHGYKHFTDTFVYKIVFDKPYPQKKIFSFRDNEIICIAHKTGALVDYTFHYTHRIHQHHYTGICLPKVKVEFEHAHCKVKSPMFTLGNAGVCIILDYLPDCFKSDEELTVTVQM